MPRRSAASLIYANPLIRSERLTAPLNLSDDEREQFIDIVASKPAEHFEKSDAALLVAYVRACAMERTASEHLAQHGVVGRNNTTSAWFNVWATANKQMLAMARQLKLSPLARRPAPSYQRRGDDHLSYYERQELLEGNADGTQPD
jgi:phage terminase small subunit